MLEPEDLELRRLALEERKAADAFDLRKQELEIEATRVRHEPRNQISVAAITVVSALVGAGASIGAAYLSGLFSIQEQSVQADANSDLEEQKFGYELIATALSEPDARARAQRLKFLLDIGLLKNLEVDEIEKYADAEQKRIEQGGEGFSKLPQYHSNSLLQAHVMATGRIERFCSGAVGTAPTTSELISCVVNTLDELNRSEAALLLNFSPSLLVEWLEAGRLPNDWRSFLP